MTATFHPAADFRRTSRTTITPDRITSDGSRVSTSHGTPNYAARRVLVVVVALAVLAAAAVLLGQAVGAVSDLGGRPAAASEVSDASGGQLAAPHVAVAGDTLWSIADRYRGEVSRERYIDALISLNGGTTVQIGQAIRLP